MARCARASGEPHALCPPAAESAGGWGECGLKHGTESYVPEAGSHLTRKPEAGRKAASGCPERFRGGNALDSVVKFKSML